jgi:hypothetical protein
MEDKAQKPTHCNAATQTKNAKKSEGWRMK